MPRIDWTVENVDKECEWLPKIAPKLPYAIPTPLAKGEPTKEYPWPWSIYNWLEGQNPVVGQIQDLTADLVQLIQAFHKIELPGGPISNRGVLFSTYEQETRASLQQLEGMIDVKAATTIWEEALQLPKWSERAVWVHGDLSPGNLLMQNGRLSAVIDFGNLGIGDPACDLIIAWNFLSARQREAFRKGLELDAATWLRGRGWALSCALVALPYYKETNPVLANQSRYVIGEILR